MKIPICILLFVLVAFVVGSVAVVAGPAQLWAAMFDLVSDGVGDLLIALSRRPADFFDILTDSPWPVLIGLVAVGTDILIVPIILGAVAQAICGKGRGVFACSVFLLGLWMGVYRLLPAGLGSVLDIGFNTVWTGAMLGSFLAAAACVLSDAAGLTWPRGATCLGGAVAWLMFALLMVVMSRQDLAQLINPDGLGEEREALEVIVGYVSHFASMLLLAAVPAVLFRALFGQGRGAFAAFSAMLGLYPAWCLAATWSLPLPAGFGVVLGLALACAVAAWFIGGLFALGMQARCTRNETGAGDGPAGSVVGDTPPVHSLQVK